MVEFVAMDTTKADNWAWFPGLEDLWVLLANLRFCCLVMQLRNLVWATSKHDVYLMSHFSVIHWSSLTCSDSEVLNVSGHVAPSEVGGVLGKMVCFDKQR